MPTLDIVEVLRRAHYGPVCTVKEWDSKIIPATVARKLREHGLQKACDPQNPINCDDALADEFYRAGFELAADIGVLCQDTERVIQVAPEELQAKIDAAPSELALGTGPDRVVLKHRQPEDRNPPLCGAPLGIAVSEELWVPLHHGIVKDRRIDIFIGGSLVTVYGLPVLGNTPLETLAGKLERQKRDEVLRLAGREGMPVETVISSTTAFGQFGGYRKGDIALVLSPTEIKTTYDALHKVVFAEGVIRSGTPSMIGGYAGSPEGTAVANIAGTLLQFAVHQASYAGGGLYDLRYSGTCGREALWTYSVICQAFARNTHLLIDKISNQVAGPCTEMILWESAIGMMNTAVSGASITDEPRSAGGKYTDHLTPLECWFCAEVLKACAGMTRAQANELARTIVPKYEASLIDPPKGKSFPECFDLQTLEPTREWRVIYDNVKRELVQMGVPLET